MPESMCLFIFYKRTSPRIQSAPHPVLIQGWDHKQDDVFSHVCVCPSVSGSGAATAKQPTYELLATSPKCASSFHTVGAFTSVVRYIRSRPKAKKLNRIKNYTSLYFSAVLNPFRTALFALVPIS